MTVQLKPRGIETILGFQKNDEVTRKNLNNAICSLLIVVNFPRLNLVASADRKNENFFLSKPLLDG